MREDFWIGYSVKNGWVALDRNLPPNHSGSRAELVFYRLNDKLLYKENYSNFEQPEYKYHSIYIESLSEPEKQKAKSELQGIEKTREEIKAHIKLEYDKSVRRKILDDLIYKHTNHLLAYHLQNSGMTLTTASNKLKHQYCWKCKNSIEKSFYECLSCRWLVCTHCGACGCGRS